MGSPFAQLPTLDAEEALREMIDPEAPCDQTDPGPMWVDLAATSLQTAQVDSLVPQPSERRAAVQATFSIGRPQHRRCFYCHEFFTRHQQPCSHAVCLADGRILCLQEGCKAIESHVYSNCKDHQAKSCRSLKDIPKTDPQSIAERCERFLAGVYTFSNPTSAVPNQGYSPASATGGGEHGLATSDRGAFVASIGTLGTAAPVFGTAAPAFGVLQRVHAAQLPAASAATDWVPVHDASPPRRPSVNVSVYCNGDRASFEANQATWRNKLLKVTGLP